MFPSKGILFLLVFLQMSSSNDTANANEPESLGENEERESNAQPTTEANDASKSDESKPPDVSKDTDTLQPVLSTTTTAGNASNVINPSADSSEYAQHITYNDKGVAIYTDPSTNYQYQFDKESNQWVPISSENSASTDQYENEYYRWCHETNEWILKDNVEPPKTTETENEFYKWDAIKNQWIPKTTSAENCVSEYKDGVHTYTDKDGVVFFWDDTKNAWFPKIDDDFMAVYQMNYGFVDNTGGDGGGPSKTTAPDVVPKLVENEDKTQEAAAKGVKRKPEPPS